MMFWNVDGIGWWGYAGMGVGMVLFWALIIAGVVALVRLSSGGGRPPSTCHAPTPEQVLAERFAHGEINEKEYRERLAVIRD